MATKPKAKSTAKKAQTAKPKTKSKAPVKAKSKSSSNIKPHSKPLVLITGAAGFVGSHVLEEFTEAGFRVRATDQPGSDFSFCEEHGAEIVPADLTDAAAVNVAVKGAEIVVHAGALYNLAASATELMAVNKGGTRNMCEAAVAAGVKRFFCFSTADALGQMDNPPGNEETPPKPNNPYSKSKYAGEQLALEYYREKGLPVTIIRPALVYGERSKYVPSVFFIFPAIADALGARQVHALAGGTSLSWVHARDIARAIRFMLDKKESIGEVYLLADEHFMCMEELGTILFEAFDIDYIPAFNIPDPITAFGGKFLLAMPPAFYDMVTKRLQKVWKKEIEKYDLVPAFMPRMDHDFMNYLGGDRTLDSTKLRNLGFKFLHPSSAEGLRQTVAWYKEQHWLPSK